jgi:two-component system, chemotaxis family, protein-glutamate methylesterase/glutaminase
LNYQLIVIGSSQGGVKALKSVFSVLPRDFPIPIVLVLHRHPDSDNTLARQLQRNSNLKIEEPEDKTKIRLGKIYLAPSGYHLLIEKDHFALSTEAPVEMARPSIDVLFESAADIYGENVIGIILTGASSDGAKGLAQIKTQGGMTICQDPREAEANNMPGAAIDATQMDKVLPLHKIGLFLNTLNNHKQVIRS